MHGHTEIEVEDWFRKAAGGPRVTRAATEALNVIPKYGRLEIRKNFFTVRATNSWNNIPSEITVNCHLVHQDLKPAIQSTEK